MSFAKKVFQDGEWSYDTPQWRINLEKLEEDMKPINFREDNKHFGSNEVGLRHPENGSYIRITDDGSIEAFTAYGTGLRINADNSIQVFSDKIQNISKEFDLNTTPNYRLDHSVYKTYPKDKGFSLDSIEKLKNTGIETYNSEEWKTP